MSLAPLPAGRCPRAEGSLPEAHVNPEISGVWLRRSGGAWKAERFQLHMASAGVGVAASPFFPLRELGRPLNN